MAAIQQREIQVFRETIRLEEALLQARATFEDPGIASRCVLADAGKQPAERVVLLDDMRLQTEICGKVQQLLARNHVIVLSSSWPVPTAARR